MKISRRNFIRIISLSSLSLASFPILNSGCQPSKEERKAISSFYSNFKNPPNTSKPFVRWWWNGNRLQKDEILRELDLLKEAGIGGVEINPIAFPGGDELDIPSLEWLSEEWIKMVKTAVEGAHARDMICDIIVGSGWPFGGEFLNKEEQTRFMELGTRKLEGPGYVEISRQELLEEGDEDSEYKELYSVHLVPTTMNKFEEGKDLTDEFTNGTLSIDLSTGEHVLYFLVLHKGYQTVTLGAPGSSGPVLNHYNQSAVKRYLKKMSKALNPRLNGMGSAFRAMFCDSLELHSNWCDDMLEEFQKRRGYSLKPYLPFILFEGGLIRSKKPGEPDFDSLAKEEVERATYDFCITRQELFEERFVNTYQEWCEANNVKSRVQAYGIGYHPLESSMKVDIPECETWLRPEDGTEEQNTSHFRGDGRAHTAVNKFLASASSLSGKKLVSCEEITNVFTVFFTTMEMLKIVGDQSNISGVNHSVLHGFNYSPIEAKFPGWIRFGTYFNERNTWWPYIRHWTDYKARLSYVFQNAETRSDIALMHPLADIWKEHGLQFYPFPQKKKPHYQHELWEAIHKNGNTCDYISEKILQEGKIEEGGLNYNGRIYHTIMLMEVDSMEPETAKALARFADSGGKLIFIGFSPSKSTGLRNYRENDSLVQQNMERITKDYPETCQVVQPPGTDLIGWFTMIQRKMKISPQVEIHPPNQNVNLNQYIYGDKEIYFFINYHKHKNYFLSATFDTGNKTPWIWDPETGERYVYPYKGQKNQLDIELQPAGSKLIVFDEESNGKTFPVKKADLASARRLEGPWDVRLNHVDGSRKRKTLDNLVDFKEKSELKSFAGTAIYNKTVKLNSNSSYAYIDLGEVHGISELSVNGNKVGVKWYGDHLYEVEDFLMEGSNNIQIKIITVLGNYCKSLEDNEICQRWTKNQPYTSVGLLGPVKLMKKQNNA